MQAIMESIFDVGYLLFAIGAGIILLRRGGGRGLPALLGMMCIILGCGDAFHLVPRVMSYWMAGDFTAAKGFGTLVTSVTMTVFYLLLEYVRRIRYGIEGEKGIVRATWLWLAVLLSFLFYFPVVLFADALPIVGMMMLPKTCMYIWMMGMLLRAAREA